MASLAEKFVMPPTVEILEAMAARRAIIFMDELGLCRAIFEGDSATIVKALSRDCLDWSSIGKKVFPFVRLDGIYSTRHFLFSVC